MLVDIRKEDEQGNIYVLREPGGLTVDWRGKRVTVPYGFRSDGASVPRFFWRWVFPPGDTRALRAAFVHDWIYRTHPEGWTKADADQLFRELLVENGMPGCRSGTRAGRTGECVCSAGIRGIREEL